MSNPIASLSTAEGRLISISTIRAVAAKVDQIGADAVDAAVEDLCASVQACKVRLAQNYSRMQQIVGSLIDELAGIEGLLEGDLAANDLPESADKLASLDVPAEVIELTAPAVPTPQRCGHRNWQHIAINPDRSERRSCNDCGAIWDSGTSVAVAACEPAQSPEQQSESAAPEQPKPARTRRRKHP